MLLYLFVIFCLIILNRLNNGLIYETTQKFSASACPSGFRYQPGDKVGNPTEIERKKLNNIKSCSTRCQFNPKCNSIEWSDSDSTCVMLTARYTDGPQWLDYRFCSKLIGK